ncbi:MAG: helix-turn-helix domain-containing protein [SAR86 cluster bacterium]|uniref:Helix-turn-helix domain-containing protein n=1 Tax=SAR86 cluster bacterium TaxID=2030880 RepID=A0A937I2N8_9GAMM|nr:helix-turn-helix domain-containing protein [SAR86 cluster bacterium]
MESWNEQLKSKILESEFSIKEISDKTKIPTKFIEAIERADFKKLPAEIFAKSQIERLFKFLGIDPSEALKDYDEFISPPEISSEEEPLADTKFKFQNFLDYLNLPNVSNSYFKYGGILFISIILLILMFAISDDDEIDILAKKEKENAIESLEIDNQDLLISSSEEELLNKNEIKNDLFSNDEIIDNLSPKDLIRKIEIVIEGESWVVVFDKNERLLYELMQTGSYELSGISPIRFKIGYAPATNLYIDDQKISFSKAIKGASNYAHFWVNEANKVESIRD